MFLALNGRKLWSLVAESDSEVPGAPILVETGALGRSPHRWDGLKEAGES